MELLEIGSSVNWPENAGTCMPALRVGERRALRAGKATNHKMDELEAP